MKTASWSLSALIICQGLVFIQPRVKSPPGIPRREIAETCQSIIFDDVKMDKYPVIIGETSMVFEFVSEGIRGSIPKLVIYSETHLHHFYNLGFGDKDAVTGQIDDEVVTNNGDSEKVLATVASTLYIFTDKFPDAMVFATGSTKARTRLYRMGISNHLEEIQEDFEVFGLISETWQPFQKQMEFEAFLVKRKRSKFTA